MRIETKIVYQDAIDTYAVFVNLPAAGWVLLQGFLTKEKASQICEWWNLLSEENG